MATLSGYDICQKSSGIAMLLSKQCRTNELIDLDADTSIEIKENNPFAVVNFIGSRNYQDTFSLGHNYLMMGFDLLSVAGKDDLAVKDLRDYFCWWENNGKITLRKVIYKDLLVSIGHPTLTIRDKDGNIKLPTPQPKIIHHASMRYFRLSQISEDVFEAFRNLYLSFELLLTKIRPKKKNEGEGKWIKDVLSVVDKSYNLSNIYKKKSTNIVDAIYNEIYIDIRCNIFHAKQNFLVAKSINDMEKVRQGFISLTKIVIFLMENYLNVRYLTGGLFVSAFTNVYNDILSKSTLTITDISNRTTELPTRLAPDLSSDDLVYVIGEIESPKIDNIGEFSKFELKGEKKELLTGEFEGLLTLDGIDHFELQVGIQLINLNQPKHHFSK